MKWLERFARSPRSDRPTATHNPRLLLALEPRMMFDGAIAATTADVVDNLPTPTDTAQDAPAQDDTLPMAAAGSDSRRELVFIDARIQDAQQLIAGLPAGSEVVLLDGQRSGLEQIAEYLDGRSGIDAIHLLSHGEAGVFRAGSDWIDAHALAAQSATLARIGAALSEHGDILLYGCKTGEGAAGAALVNELARLTQADVAASSDNTGALALGGDWVLETRSGSIDSLALAPTAFSGLLAAPTSLNFDSVNLSADADGDPTRSFGGSPRVFDGWTVTLHNSAGTMVTEASQDYLDVTNNTGDNDLVDGAGDKALTVQGFLGSTASARFTATSGEEFWLQSFVIQNINMNSGVRVEGYREGNLVASHDFTLNGGLGVYSTITLDHLGDQDWQNIDQFRIVQQNGSADLWFAIDDIVVAPKVLPNTPPTATNLTQGVTVTEGGSTVALSDIVITDPDASDTLTATLTLSSPAAGALSTGTFGSATSSYNPGTGVWSVTGSRTDVNAALAAVALTPSADNDQNFTITTRIRDAANSGPADGIISVSVTAVNDAPVVSTSGGNSSFIENAGGSVIDASLTLSDVDNATLASARVAITGNFASGQDVLAFVNDGSMGNISASYDAGTGVLTLTSAGASATLAQWQAALRSVTYSNGSDAPSTAARTISFRVNDGTADSNLATKVLNVTAVNDAPQITAPATLSVTEDQASVLTGISFADPDAGSNTVTATFSVPSGTLSATSSGSVTVGGTSSALTLSGSLADLNAFIAAGQLSFQTATNATANVVLSISINDGGNTGGGALTDSTTLTLAVTAVNDAPVNSLPAAQSVDQDASLVFSSGNGNLISISDVDAGAGILRVTLSASNGLLSLAGTSGLTFSTGDGSNDSSMTFNGTLIDINNALNGLSFSPTAGYNGAAALTIETSDLGLSGSGGTQVDTDTLNITVNSVQPRVTAVNATVADGTYKVGDVITISITFDQVVTVDTNGGIPSLLLETGSIDRAATYVSGSGSTTLTFSYTVQAGDISADLDYASTSALSLNGGTIQDGTSQSANLTLPTPGAAGSLGAIKALVVDGVRPTATSITLSDTALRIGETATVTVTFNEAVSGLTPVDFSVANGALSNLASVDGGITWTATLTPGANVTAAGNLITLDNTGYTDAAGNTGSGSTDSNSYSIDTQRPSATLVVADSTLKAGQSTTVTITFNEAVSGLTPADFSVANGALSNLASVDGGITWTATLTPGANVTAAGNLITLDNTGYTDAAGNTGSGSTDSNSYSIDTQRPSATLVVADSTLKAGQSTTVTITFSEAVSGLTTADFSVANGALSDLASSDGGITWTATLTPNANVTDTSNLITLDNTGYTDTAGNTGSGSTDSNNYAIDSKAPVVTSVGVPANGTYLAGDNLDFTVNFDEAVTVDTSGGTPRLAITLDTGGTVYASYLSGSGSNALVFRHTLASGVQDTNGISLAGSIHGNGGQLRDGAGNLALNTLNGVAATTGVLVDSRAPVVVSLAPQVAQVDSGSATFTLQFDENVSGVDLADLQLAGSASGTLQSLTQIDPRTYQITVTNISGRGSLNLVLNAAGSGISDAMGNALGSSFSGSALQVGRQGGGLDGGDPEFRSNPPVTVHPPVPLPPVQAPPPPPAPTSPLLPPPLFTPPSPGGGLPTVGTIFIGEGSNSPSFIAQVFASSDSGGDGSGSGFLGFGGGDGGVFGSSSLAGAFSGSGPSLPVSLFGGSTGGFGSLDGGELRQIFGAPSLSQQLHDHHAREARQVATLTNALEQLGNA